MRQYLREVQNVIFIFSRSQDLQKFLTELEKTSADFKSTVEYQEIESSAKNKIRALDSNLHLFQNFFDEVEKKLQTPELKKNIKKMFSQAFK